MDHFHPVIYGNQYLCGAVSYGLVLYGIVYYCMVLYIIVWYCILLYGMVLVWITVITFLSSLLTASFISQQGV